jgi:heat shock protein HslJ
LFVLIADSFRNGTQMTRIQHFPRVVKSCFDILYLKKLSHRIALRYFCGNYQPNKVIRKMRNLIVSVCMTVAIAALSSCGSSKNAVSASSLGGTWNIIEVNGTAVVPAPGQEFPFLTFDVTEGRVSGNTGCNRVSGTFDAKAKAGTLTLGALVSTRMACMDMSLENKVLAALNEVKKMKTLSDNTVSLFSSNGKSIVVLQKKKMPRM